MHNFKIPCPPKPTNEASGKSIIRKIDEIIFEEYGRIKGMPDIEKEKKKLFRDLAWYSPELAVYADRRTSYFADNEQLGKIETRKLKPELVEAMNEFAIRILKGEGSEPQEIAILPQIIDYLKTLPEE